MSRIYYEFDEDLDASAGRPIGGGWRRLESRVTADRSMEYHVIWKPSTGERIVYAKPVHVREASPLVPPAPEHVRTKRVRRG